MISTRAKILLIETAVSSFLFGAVFPNPTMFISTTFLVFFFSIYIILTVRRFSSLNGSSIDVHRWLSAEELPEGSPAEIRVRVELDWEGRVEVRDVLPLGLRLIEGTSHVKSVVKGRGAFDLSYKASLWRGMRAVRFKEVACTLSDPWELVVKTVYVPCAGEIRLSRERARSTDLETSGVLLGPAFGTVTNPFIGEDVHFSGVRPFLPGDKLRSVHWRKTATLTDNEVLVKKFERLARGNVVAVIDCSPEMRFGTSPDYFDDVLAFLEPLFSQFVEQGNALRVFAVTGDGLLSLKPRSGSEVEAFLRALEVSEVTSSRYASEVVESLTGGTLLILATSFASAQIGELSEVARAATSMGCRVLIIYPRLESYLGPAMELVRNHLKSIKERDLASFPEECNIEELEGVPSFRVATRSVTRED